MSLELSRVRKTASYAFECAKYSQSCQNQLAAVVWDNISGYVTSNPRGNFSEADTPGFFSYAYNKLLQTDYLAGIELTLSCRIQAETFTYFESFLNNNELGCSKLVTEPFYQTQHLLNKLCGIIDSAGDQDLSYETTAWFCVNLVPLNLEFQAMDLIAGHSMSYAVLNQLALKVRELAEFMLSKQRKAAAANPAIATGRSQYASHSNSHKLD